MIETLYQRVAATGGLPEVSGPERPALLKQAGAEAARAAMPKMNEDRKRALAGFLLPDCWLKGAERDRLLEPAIAQWCAACWDGAAPVPESLGVSLTLGCIAGNRLANNNSGGAGDMIRVGLVLGGFLVLIAIIIGLQSYKSEQRRLRPAAQAQATVAALRAQTPLPPMPAPTLPPVTTPLPDLMGPVWRDVGERVQRDLDRIEQQDMRRELIDLRADLARERYLRQSEELYGDYGNASHATRWP